MDEIVETTLEGRKCSDVGWLGRHFRKKRTEAWRQTPRSIRSGMVNNMRTNSIVQLRGIITNMAML